MDRPVRFAKYELLQRLAVGGMAEIFLARQRGLAGFEKILAVKRIRKKFTQEPSFVQMFLNEARIAARLSHPNVVQIFDLGKAEGCFFIAMEYVHGRDLAAVVQRAEERRVRFPLEYAVKIASQVCDGLHYAHTKRDADGTQLDIVHRDISPLNLLVSFDGVVKILDFGIARAERYYREERTGKKVKGKLTYMAPETVEGQKEDNRTDIFALGMVFYELITGLKVRSQKSDQDLFRSILKGKIHPPSFFRADLPEEVEEIALKALARDPAERYQQARDMQYDLDAFLVESGFNPGALHLANFVRQLFQEDLDEEEKKLAKVAKARPAPGGSADPFPEEEEPEDDEIFLEADLKIEPDSKASAVEPVGDKGKGPPKVVALRLGQGEFDVLREAGRRHGKTAGELAREIVRAHLKFL